MTGCKKASLVLLTGLLLAASVSATDYVPPDQVVTDVGPGIDHVVDPYSGYSDAAITDYLEEYYQAAEFLTTLQYLEPDDNFGGMIEAEHLPNIIQTDNTEEAVWIWSHYYELSGRDDYRAHIDAAWDYILLHPSYLEEGGNHPNYGYYRHYVSGWALLAEMKFRQVYGEDTYSVYADSAADYMIDYPLNHEWSTLNVMVRAWALGCLYLYGEDVGSDYYMTYADTTMAVLKEWVERSPAIRLGSESWAMSGGAVVWGLANSYFREHPAEEAAWMEEYAPYMDTFKPSGEWVIAHNAWYALGHYSAFDATDDSTWLDNHLYLADTLLAEDGDDDGGIPANFIDFDDEDQSWCTAYLGFMCLDPTIGQSTAAHEGRQALPAQAALIRSYPNPFNGPVALQVVMPNAGFAAIDIYDLTGRKVAQPFSGEMEAGPQTVLWQAGELSSGVYLARLRAGGVSATTRVTLVK